MSKSSIATSSPWLPSIPTSLSQWHSYIPFALSASRNRESSNCVYTTLEELHRICSSAATAVEYRLCASVNELYSDKSIICINMYIYTVIGRNELWTCTADNPEQRACELLSRNDYSYFSCFRDSHLILNIHDGTHSFTNTRDVLRWAHPGHSISPNTTNCAPLMLYCFIGESTSKYEVLECLDNVAPCFGWCHGWNFYFLHYCTPWVVLCIYQFDHGWRWCWYWSCNLSQEVAK